MSKLTITQALDLLPPLQADELRDITKRLDKLNSEAVDLEHRRWTLMNSVKPLGERYANQKGTK